MHNNNLYRNINYKRPKIKTIVAFLQTKGWSLAKKDKRFQYFAPPKEEKLDDPDFHFKVPVHEKGMDYEEYTYHLLIGFSQFYDIDLQFLFDLLSKDLVQIAQEKEIQERMLAMAS